MNTVKLRILQDPTTIVAPVQYTTGQRIRILIFNRFRIECSVNVFDCERDEWMVSLRDDQKITKAHRKEIDWYVAGILDTLRSL